jgi:hypothetical protein
LLSFSDARVAVRQIFFEPSFENYGWHAKVWRQVKHIYTKESDLYYDLLKRRYAKRGNSVTPSPITANAR